MAILNELTRREIDILKLLVQGLENKEIADRLGAAEQTIKNGVSVIYTKLGVDNGKKVRRFALSCGLVRPEDVLRSPEEPQASRQEPRYHSSTFSVPAGKARSSIPARLVL